MELLVGTHILFLQVWRMALEVLLVLRVLAALTLVLEAELVVLVVPQIIARMVLVAVVLVAIQVLAVKAET